MRLGWVVVLLLGCSSGSGRPRTVEPVPERPREGNPLFVAPGSYDFTANPRLLERVRSSAHGYFRFVNIAFSDCVCRRYSDALPSIPRVNLHGDAHIEQYAVTSIG